MKENRPKLIAKITFQSMTEFIARVKVDFSPAQISVFSVFISSQNRASSIEY